MLASSIVWAALAIIAHSFMLNFSSMLIANELLLNLLLLKANQVCTQFAHHLNHSEDMTKFSRLAPHHRPARNPKVAGRASGNRPLRPPTGSPSRDQSAAVYGQQEHGKGPKYELFGHQQHFASEAEYPNLYPNAYQPMGELSGESQLVLTFNQAAISQPDQLTCQRADNQQLYGQLDHYYQQPAQYSADPDHWQLCPQVEQQQFSHNMIEPGNQQNQERAFYLAGEQNGYVVYADQQANLQLQIQVDATSQQNPNPITNRFNELANT